MGSIIEAHCTCGYQREMALGGGMTNFTTYCNFPAYCSKCKVLFETNLFEKVLRCPNCGDKNALPYDNEELCQRKGKPVFEWNFPDQTEKVLKLTDGEYLCPGCGRYTMSFRDVGNWE